MGDTPTGIHGVDLLELDIISKDRLPAAASDYRRAAGLVHPWNSGIFTRTAKVGNYPNGPSANWCALAQLLDDACTTTATNMEETAAALKGFLQDILNTDAGAKDRLDKARAELDGIPPG